jgi:hypothetical protein
MKIDRWVRTSAEEDFSIFVKNSQLGQVSSTLAASFFSFMCPHPVFLSIKRWEKSTKKALNGKKK